MDKWMDEKRQTVKFRQKKSNIPVITVPSSQDVLCQEQYVCEANNCQ